MQLHGKPDRERTIILVAPPGAMVRVVRRRCDEEAIVFSSVEEFQRWSAAHGGDEQTIRHDVLRALQEIGCRLPLVSQQLRSAIDSLGDRGRTPALCDLEKQWPSRRSLYRSWRAEIAEPPGAFLRRVRALHARRLLAQGWTRKQSAAAAGFSSVDQMRRHVRRAGALASL